MYFISDINIIISEGQLFSAGSYFFVVLHQNSSYALDQKQITKNPGAAYEYGQYSLKCLKFAVCMHNVF